MPKTAKSPTYGESPTRTRWSVECPVHGPAFLTEDEYRFQLDRSNEPFQCPRVIGRKRDNVLCLADSKFDHELCNGAFAAG